MLSTQSGTHVSDPLTRVSHVSDPLTSLCIRWLKAGWIVQQSRPLVEHYLLQVGLLRSHAIANLIPNIGKRQRAAVQLLPLARQVLSSVQ